jgi:hypothetical protein
MKKYSHLVSAALVVFMSLCGSVSWAERSAEDREIREKMHQFYANLIYLKPYIVSKKEFEDPKNKEKILKILNSFSVQSGGKAPERVAKSKGFRMTFDLLSQHLSDTKKYIESGDAGWIAWSKLNATTQFCIACHTRVPVNQDLPEFAWTRGDTKNMEQASLADANFYFIARLFDRAISIYDRKIRSYKDSKMRTDELGEIYQKKIAYFARILRDPKLAIESLNEDLKNKALPVETISDIKTWLRAFEEWKNEKGQDPSKMSDKDLAAFAEKIVEDNTGGRSISLSDPYVVNLMRVSGLLYERLVAQPKEEYEPTFLYLLSKCERALMPLSIYSLADIYLKRCVQDYPKHPVAKKCFAEYELYMKTRLGTSRSSDVLKSIEALKRYIE